MRTQSFLALLVLPGLALWGQPDDDSLEASARAEVAATPTADGSLARVMDAFLRAYSADTPAWRMDVQLGRATADSVPPDGYQKGRSELAGWFYFRPKTSDLLGQEQRRAILRDKRFAQFIAQMRAVADGDAPALDPGLVAAAKPKPVTQEPVQIGRAELMAKLLAGRRPPPDTIYFEIAPEELSLPGRLLVTTNTNPTP